MAHRAHRQLRQPQFRRVAPFLVGLLSLSLTAGCRHPVGTAGNSAPAPSPTAAGGQATSALLLPAPSAPSPADAAALWRRTIAALHSVPARATVTDTHYTARGGVAHSSRYDVIEGGGDTLPRYRLTYREPTAQEGVLVVSDGRTGWRYDPRTRVAEQFPAAAMAIPPELEEGVSLAVSQADRVVPEVEPQVETVAGRATRVLALRRQRSRRILERRWVDVATGRTLRMEEYSRPDARLLRRVEVQQIAFPPPAAKGSGISAGFEFDPPADAVIVDGRSPRTRQRGEAEAAARRAHLPLHVRGFTVRSARRTEKPVAAASPHPTTGEVQSAVPASPLPGATMHLLYSDGDRAISVFVTPNAVLTGGKPVVLQPGPDWKPTSLDVRRAAFTQESEEGAAVAWAEPEHGFYIAVARMPLSDLLPLAGALAANRDDAPAASVLPAPLPEAHAASYRPK